MVDQYEYRKYCQKFSRVWEYLCDTSFEVGSVADEICSLRGYSPEGNMHKMLRNIGFVYPNQDQFDVKVVKSFDDGELGLFSEEGHFILNDRFIFPVRDMLGNIIALIGWLPDEKKYITSSSRFFSKKCLMFGLEQLKQTGIGKKYILVEGIFDCISVRSLGLNCVALMGITATQYTEVMYTLFKKLVAIPDNDSEGRKVITDDRWKLPSNGTYLRWSGGLKDIDDLCTKYDMYEDLKNAISSNERVLTLGGRYD